MYVTADFRFGPRNVTPNFLGPIKWNQRSHIFKILYFTQLSYKRIFDNSRASAINLDLLKISTWGTFQRQFYLYFPYGNSIRYVKLHVWYCLFAVTQFLWVLHLCFGHKWNLTSLDKLCLSSWLVTLASDFSSNHLSSDSLSSQLVQSTWKVSSLKSH